MITTGANPRSAGRPWGVWLTVAAAMGVFTFCSLVVWYSFMVTPETNCIVHVAGNPDLEGVTVEVRPTVAADPDRACLSVRLDARNQFHARFFLPSGTYRVLLLRPDGSPITQYTDFVPPGQRWTYDLTRHRLPASSPTTSQTVLLR